MYIIFILCILIAKYCDVSPLCGAVAQESRPTEENLGIAPSDPPLWRLFCRLAVALFCDFIASFFYFCFRNYLRLIIAFLDKRLASET
jgi:hypothetical protein